MIKPDPRNDKGLDLAVLARIAGNPDITQAVLAEELNVSIGTVNARLKQLVQQGSIEVKQAKRRKLRYIITPEGRALQRRLTDDYVQQSFDLFRQVRQHVNTDLKALNDTETDALCLQGSGDIAEVCRLICLENGIRITDEPGVPNLVVEGLDIRIEQP